jgi:hypothetical protein
LESAFWVVLLKVQRFFLPQLAPLKVRHFFLLLFVLLRHPQVLRGCLLHWEASLLVLPQQVQ